jgi:hypothetical protein
MIDRTVTISIELGRLVREEIELLRQRRPGELSDLAGRKAELTALYQQEMASLRENPELVRAAPPGDAERLKDSTFLLHGILDEYHTTLNAAKTVTERLVKAIGDEISSRRQVVKNYGADAMYSSQASNGAQATASIALNEVI